MKVGFIGAGKVGKSFGKYLSNNGFNIQGYYSRSIESSKISTEIVGGHVFVNLEELVKASTVVFITTPDDVIPLIVEEICKLKELQEEKLFIHMSGAHSSNILNDIKVKHKNSYLYSLHPLQAFADVVTAVEDLKNTVFSIEGDEEQLSVLTKLMETCGNDFFIIQGEDKALYHSAACVVSNYLVTLIDLGLRLFEASNIDSQKGFNALSPLILGSLNNIKKLGTAEALTGPIARGDINTIKNHLSRMEEKVPHLMELYKVLGEETTKLATVKKLNNQENIDSLNQLWKEGKL